MFTIVYTILELLARKWAKFDSLKLPIPKDNFKKWFKIVCETYFKNNLFDSYRNGS